MRFPLNAQKFKIIGIIPLLILALLPAISHAQIAQPAANVIQISADAAQFRINDSLSLGEIYFAVPRDRLHFVEENDSVLVANYQFDVEIWRQNKHITTQTWTSSSKAANRDEIKVTQFLFNVAKFQFKPGSYVIKARVSDLNGPAHGVKNIPFTIRSHPDNELALSDIELATKITRDTTQSVYYRNGYHVIPNPGRLYGDGLIVLRFYMEVYGLTTAPNSTYLVQYRIFDANGEIAKQFAPRQKSVAAKNLVEIGGINIVTLHTGVYKLQVIVRDKSSGQQTSREALFYIYRKRDIPEQKDVAAPVVSKNLLYKLYNAYDEQKLDTEFESVNWIATQEEKEIYKSLDAGGKKQFMGRFWYSRDPDSTTVRNEYREDYLSRAEYARKNFGGLKKGTKSDRGRVLLLYGIPSEIERFPSEQGLRSYQIWHYYELEGGIDFWFVDTHDWGDYTLVHSTARNELRDDDWQRWLTIQ
ncbi:MAG: hypothetical protein DWQ10_13000 [Calditrichaeota bacterium]|nr:MAG: hypothetical protein DWQ10_13000 [Calditrichota bacterium]